MEKATSKALIPEKRGETIFVNSIGSSIFPGKSIPLFKRANIFSVNSLYLPEGAASPLPIIPLFSRYI